MLTRGLDQLTRVYEAEMRRLRALVKEVMEGVPQEWERAQAIKRGKAMEEEGEVYDDLTVASHYSPTVTLSSDNDG